MLRCKKLKKTTTHFQHNITVRGAAQQAQDVSLVRQVVRNAIPQINRYQGTIYIEPSMSQATGAWAQNLYHYKISNSIIRVASDVELESAAVSRDNGGSRPSREKISISRLAGRR